MQKHYLLLAATIFFLGANAASAQAPLEPAQMPANTTFYFVWRGQPNAELRKTNSIAALWDDPGFAPVRSSVTDAILKSSEEKPTENRLTRQQIEEYASLLENAFVLGYLSDPQKKRAEASGDSSAANTKPWNGMFLVYDRTGKEAILSKAVLSLRSSEKEVPQVSQTTIAGVPVLKVQRKTGVTYWVEHGKYAVSANEPAVLEVVLNRLAGKPSSTAALTDSPAYKEAHSVLGSGQAEFFLRVPDLQNLASESTAGGFRMGPMLEALRLDSIHSVCGRVLMEGAKTRVQAVALGDTTPGSLFDIWDKGSAAPASLNFVPADAVSYSDTQINLAGLYDAVKRIAASVLPPGQQGNVDMLELMAQSKLGQSLSSALALFTGEFASLQTSPSLDNNKQIYLVGIRDKPGTLKLIHTLLSDKISSERAEGETTFLKVSAGGSSSAAGNAQWDFYHVAATSDYLVVGSRLEPVREVLAKRSQSAGAGLTSAPGFQAARAQFPATINGLGYFDFRKVDWQALKARVIAEANKTPTAKRSPGAGTSTATPTPSWMLDINPEVFAHHLHVASSASWKDAQGLHFDEWIE
ncbi:MAG TPA: DUF3352 domain-containing protein [Candidatus Eremiobacteraceae bacterium]|nr:DUF3352 domain-containing protein [Candidatus Eremiobacteraceae bacterium]